MGNEISQTVQNLFTFLGAIILALVTAYISHYFMAKREEKQFRRNAEHQNNLDYIKRLEDLVRFAYQLK